MKPTEGRLVEVQARLAFIWNYNVPLERRLIIKEDLKKIRFFVLIFSVDFESVLEFLFKGWGEKLEILTFLLKV